MIGPDAGAADLPQSYHESRERLSAVIATVSDPASVPVPACPGWSVHDVLSHLVAVIEDVMAGRLTGPPDGAATAEQVARRWGRPTEGVLEEWSDLSSQMEELLRSVPIWPVAMDVLSHEQDVRGAVGVPGARDLPIIRSVAAELLTWFEPPVALTVHLAGQTFEHLSGGDGTEAQLALETSPYELFRFRLGRRSRRQLTAMAWSGDPEPILDGLTIFGPSLLDIIE